VKKRSKKNLRIFYIWGGSYIVLVISYFMTDRFTKFSLSEINTSFINVFYDSDADYSTSPTDFSTNKWKSGTNVNSNYKTFYENNESAKTNIYNYTIVNNNLHFRSDGGSNQVLNISDIMQSSNLSYHRNNGTNTSANLGSLDVNLAFAELFLKRNLSENIFDREKQNTNASSIFTDNATIFSTHNSDADISQKIGIDPEGDPTGAIIPIGDGYGFLILLALVYAGFQWYSIRTKDANCIV